MRELIFSLPMLPTSMTANQKSHRRHQRDEEKKWQDYIASEWATMGKPKFSCIHVTLIFSFPEKSSGDLASYLATGSRLVGDAIKGLLIPDVGPEHLTAWNFRCKSGSDAQTDVIIEEEKKGYDTSQRSDCNLYETCNTPLCPLDQTGLAGIWYPGEEICRSRSHGNIPWVQAQRKLAKVAAVGYFTVAMLTRLAVIRQGISGLDPNVPEQQQLRAWFQKRVEKKDVPPEEKAERSRHLKNYTFKKQVEGEV